MWNLKVVCRTKVSNRLTLCWLCSRRYKSVLLELNDKYINSILTANNYCLLFYRSNYRLTGLLSSNKRGAVIISGSNASFIINWWKGKPSGSIACTRKQQSRFYWSCSAVVMNDATPHKTCVYNPVELLAPF